MLLIQICVMEYEPKGLGRSLTTKIISLIDIFILVMGSNETSLYGTLCIGGSDNVN